MGDERSFKPNTLSFDEAWRMHSWSPLVGLVFRAADRLERTEGRAPHLRHWVASLLAFAPLLMAGALVFSFS